MRGVSRSLVTPRTVMGPHTGQGSAMALEDSMVLAMCLRDIADIEAALATYERRRRPRVERVVNLTRRLGNTKAPGPFGRAVRDRILPIVLPMGVKQTAKVYAHRIDWDATVTPAS
jgi:2-polyprenyl-6-methoxyphenol hydroxylase-like FAD-dependent oxidoreductase